VVRPRQIAPAPTQPCMEEFYPPALTQNDVGNFYHCFVSPEAIETVPTGLLPMSPHLNMNRHIELPWRLIPECYQGLGMANFALISLASKLSYLQCNWGFSAPHSNALMIGYESFIIEIGLYGNTMGYEYKTYSILATDNTWFKNVLELVSYFNVRLHFNEDFQLKPI
jgi:hypothetical protein